jgi:hypothetical protein
MYNGKLISHVSRYSASIAWPADKVNATLNPASVVKEL